MVKQSGPLELAKQAEQAIVTAFLQQPLEPVAHHLKELTKQLPHLLPSHSTTATEVVKHALATGGKRVRPALYFLVAEMVHYRGKHLYPMAAVCEYVHMASLLHDDVVDNSTVRRCRPTANSIWGGSSSILVGDLVYSTASEIMAATGSLEIVTMFSQAIRMMSEGELFQLEHSFDFGIEESQYLKILKCKTGHLIAASCRAPAILAKANNNAIDWLDQFGHAVGMAFQLIDDALDYVGDFKIFGKTKMADIKEGKMTLPIILLRDRLADSDRKRLQGIIQHSRFQEENISYVSDLVREYDTAEETLLRAEKYTSIALEMLLKFPPSSERDNLENLAMSLVSRVS